MTLEQILNILKYKSKLKINGLKIEIKKLTLFIGDAKISNCKKRFKILGLRMN